MVPPVRAVIGAAIVRVSRLDARGEAAGSIERWLTLPSADEWALVHGPRAAEHGLPDVCTFVGGLPGELVEVELRWPAPRPGRRRARRPPQPAGRLRAVLEASPERVPARCPVFGECGGCQLQHLAYERQLAWKTERVAGLLRDAGLDDVSVAPTVGSAEPWGYRNHMRFSVDRAGRAGLTARGSHRVIPLHACPIAHPLINRALEAVGPSPPEPSPPALRAAAAPLTGRASTGRPYGSGAAAPAPCDGEGRQRGAACCDGEGVEAVAGEARLPRPQLLIRCGAATGELLVQPALEGTLRARLEAAGLEPRVDALTEALRVPGAGGRREMRFRIRPSSFFQTNTSQANRLAEAVQAGLPTGPRVTLVDAYCGVGTFAALLAPRVGRVVAVEESASAVRDATWNLHGLNNVELVQAKVEDWLPTTGERLDGLVIDPPRAGCGRAVLEALARRRVPRVVYVSCDPGTLARDLAFLCREAGTYRLVGVQPLDMFPQTAHVETVATLEAR